MSTDPEKELRGVSSADITRFIQKWGASDYFAAFAPNFPDARTLFAAFLLVLSLHGLPVAQHYLDNLNKPAAEFQIQTGSQPIIEGFPGTPRKVTIESIPVDAPVRQLLQLIPPNVHQIVRLDGPVAEGDHILSGGMYIFPVDARTSIEDLISMASDWETSLRAANQLDRKTFTYRGVPVKYTSQDALRNAVAQSPRVSPSSEIRIITHGQKWFRVATPDDAARMGNVANTIIRGTIDTLIKSRVDATKLTIETIGSVADATPAVDRAAQTASDVDFAITVKDPQTFLQVVRALDSHSVELESDVHAAFQQAFSGQVVTPRGNHAAVFLVSELGKIMDMTVVALGRSTKP